MITALFCIIFGYLAGALFRHIIKCMHAPMGHVNIQKRGIRLRRYLTLILLIMGGYFEIPLLLFFAGFAWYSSQNKWCIVKSLHVKE